MASLASRMSGDPTPPAPGNNPQQGSSWADQMKSPTTPSNQPLAATGIDGANDMEISDPTSTNLNEPDYSVEVKLSDLMGDADPNNPLYSAKSFDQLGLRPELLQGLTAMNFIKPSKIQEKALPLLLMDKNQNFVGQSQSGTGKTAAFVLNILSRIDLSRPLAPQAIVLAPTRELARQIIQVVEKMGQYLKDLKVAYAIPQSYQRNQKIEGSVVVGTPGTVQDLLRRRQLAADDIRVFVLDEADNMLDQQGLGEQCARVRQLVQHRNPQYVLFSATFPDNVKVYTERFAPGANQIMLKHEELTIEGIRQVYIDCDSEQHKFEILVKLYGLMTVGSSIIFVKRRDIATEIQRRMEKEGHVIASLHGALEGSNRDSVIDAFRSGDAKVLITTNVLARGIDVQTVTMVVNYDLPELQNGKPDCETYLHRIGRTGRFGRVGVSISFVSDKKSWTQMDEIQRYFGVEMISVGTQDWDETEEQLGKIIRSARAGQKLQGSAKAV